MDAGGFLLDEHVPRAIQARLIQMAVEIRVYAIGDDDAPPKGTPDSDLLVWIADHECLLVTNNRATMPVHLVARLAQGGHVPGIIQLPKRMDVAAIVDDLLLVWGGGEDDEFQDRIVYLPL
ncbi:MAG TPA: hypothetical protein VFW96_19335 [Thermomicrobiales bacterium]|nr:hypothetical protein [Thermomicrobiales bacterium]